MVLVCLFQNEYGLSEIFLRTSTVNRLVTKKDSQFYHWWNKDWFDIRSDLERESEQWSLQVCGYGSMFSGSEKLWEHLVKGTVVMLDDYKQGHGLSHRTAWSESWLYDFLNVWLWASKNLSKLVSLSINWKLKWNIPHSYPFPRKLLRSLCSRQREAGN